MKFDCGGKKLNFQSKVNLFHLEKSNHTVAPTARFEASIHSDTQFYFNKKKVEIIVKKRPTDFNGHSQRPHNFNYYAKQPATIDEARGLTLPCATILDAHLLTGTCGRPPGNDDDIYSMVLQHCRS